jgi:hypothetical protein
MRVVSDPRVKIPAVCQVHQGSGHLMVSRQEQCIVLDAHADGCCVLALDHSAAILLADVLGEWLE